jgi:hypothetical protein
LIRLKSTSPDQSQAIYYLESPITMMIITIFSLKINLFTINLLDMKNKNLLIFSIVVLSALLISCSKDNPVTGNHTGSIAKQENSDLTNSNEKIIPRYYGSIVGILVPAPAKARIFVFNDQYISGEATCQPDGSFEIGNLIQGGYTLRIDFVPVGAADYVSITIPKITVTSGSVTNLGSIQLD